MKRAVEAKISGIVQGIGFRPFVYREAVHNNLVGYVMNRGGEVFVHIEGNSEDIDAFFSFVKNNHPEGACIHSMEINDADIHGFALFIIEESLYDEDALSSIPSDISICGECKEDMLNPESRYFMYPFTSCAKCGPRLTTIEKLPYDRHNTTMKKFNMCPMCEAEYKNPADRRYHAQTICCPQCGPAFELVNNKGSKIEGEPFEQAKRFLRDGHIIAVKGIGGLHLICNAGDEKAVAELRRRKKRDYKPFAVMMKDIDAAKKHCFLNEHEIELLQSRERPIVLLKQKPESDLPEIINPGLHRIGVMLPYSGIHNLLFEDELEILIATSGNISGQPLITENETALKELKDVADYFMIHDRDIVCPADDSVVKCVNLGQGKNIKQTIRRSRGFAPIPFNLSCDTPKILACGADLKNNFCILKDGKAFVSQHIGEADKLETMEVYHSMIEHYKAMLNFKPEYVVCDMHPQYETTKYAKSLHLSVIEVQHHYAHIAGVLAENKCNKEVIGVAFDGTGFGTDGTVWGGEFLICSLNRFKRAGHFKQLPMPGGDLAAKQPWRMAGVYLQDAFNDEMSNLNLNCVHKLAERNWDVLWNSVSAGINKVVTSSAGRLFDAVSAILDICYENDYEGQASAELEALANVDSAGVYKYEVSDNEKIEVDFRGMIRSIVRDLQNGIDKGEIAGRFHNTVAMVVSDVCVRIREKEGINTVALGGGVFQNSLLLEKSMKKLTGLGFEVLVSSEVPCNDGGISLGQAVVASYN